MALRAYVHSRSTETRARAPVCAQGPRKCTCICVCIGMRGPLAKHTRFSVKRNSNSARGQEGRSPRETSLRETRRARLVRSVPATERSGRDPLRNTMCFFARRGSARSARGWVCLFSSRTIRPRDASLEGQTPTTARPGPVGNQFPEDVRSEWPKAPGS